MNLKKLISDVLFLFLAFAVGVVETKMFAGRAQRRHPVVLFATRDFSRRNKTNRMRKLHLSPCQRALERRYDSAKLWPLEKKKTDGSSNQEIDEDTVCLMVGMSLKRFEVETRLHALKYIEEAADDNLLADDDLKQLFRYRVGQTTLLQGTVAINKEGLCIQVPATTTSNRDKEDGAAPTRGRPTHVVVNHQDVRANLLPHRQTIVDTIRTYRARISNHALEVIDCLQSESFAIRDNLMDLSDSAWAMNMDFDQDSGPAAQARELCRGCWA